MNANCPRCGRAVGDDGRCGCGPNPARAPQASGRTGAVPALVSLACWAAGVALAALLFLGGPGAGRGKSGPRDSELLLAFVWFVVCTAGVVAAGPAVLGRGRRPRWRLTGLAAGVLNLVCNPVLLFCIGLPLWLAWQQHREVPPPVPELPAM